MRSDLSTPAGESPTTPDLPSMNTPSRDSGVEALPELWRKRSRDASVCALDFDESLRCADELEATLESLARERDELREVVNACVDYFGPMYDPSIGWCAPQSSHPDKFRCERCGAEHIDCTMIPHAKYCRAVRLLNAINAALEESK